MGSVESFSEHGAFVWHERKTNEKQTLLIDADDTLWENNIYFERAIARFISFLNHHEFSSGQVREVLNDVERECIVKHGYGLHSLRMLWSTRSSGSACNRSLRNCTRRSTASPTPSPTIPMELLPEVPETLRVSFGNRHNLILLTKGAIVEQTGKIERSGLKNLFRRNGNRCRKRCCSL